jgi:TatD DNase family protein
LYFVDTHIHLSDKLYEKYLDVIINGIKNSNLQAFSVSVDLPSSIRNTIIKKKFFLNSSSFKSFVGIHPENAYAESLDDFQNFFDSNAKQIDGIGEIGLDPTYTVYNSSNGSETQKTVFTNMLSLAEKHGKPVSLHSRRSLKEILDVLTSYRLKKVAFHWFDGNKTLLRKINDLGFYASFGPYLLYSKDKQVLLEKTDLSLLLLETDGPVGFRNCFQDSLTSPFFIISLVNFASFILKKAFDDLSETIFNNSTNFLET